MYKCSNCGYSQPRWLGRCPDCGEWNSLEEIVIDKVNTSLLSKNSQITEKAKPLDLGTVKTKDNVRFSTGISEFDRVLGGGAVKKSAILVGGEPGIGKSTLLLQTISGFYKQYKLPVLYISGEESSEQIKERALRLNLDCNNIKLLCTSRLEDCLDAMDTLNPSLIIVDSIQTIYTLETGIIPGTVNQLKYCSNEFIMWVKNHESVLIMTAHVTKEGTIAGPKSLEHMVDTVINFEKNNDDIRFLHALKNRFGAIDELGIFNMTQEGLIPISDPTTLFITKRTSEQPAGVACTPVFEGTRVFLVEIQALTIPAKANISRVYSEKIDSGRVSRIAAVIEKRCGLSFSDQDIYVNVAGGVKISESSIDAAIAIALYSARTDIAVNSKYAVFGELSLAGEIRPVTKPKQRVKACETLGFTQIFAPEYGTITVDNIRDLVKKILER